MHLVGVKSSWQVQATGIMETSRCIKRNWQNWSVSGRKIGLFVLQKTNILFLRKKTILSYYSFNYIPFSISHHFFSSISFAFFLILASLLTPHRAQYHSFFLSDLLSLFSSPRSLESDFAASVFWCGSVITLIGLINPVKSPLLTVAIHLNCPYLIHTCKCTVNLKIRSSLDS